MSGHRGDLELRAGTSWAEISPAVGGRVAQLDLGAGPVLRGRKDADSDLGWGCYPLLPWSNRIPGGLLHVDGTVHRLPVDHDDGSAIHGLVATSRWTVNEASGRAAHLTVEAASGPYVVRGELSYELIPGSLSISLTVENLAEIAVPVGLGIHPWFRHGPIQVPAARKWPGDPIPVGPVVAVDADDDLRSLRAPPPMDRCFTGLEGTSARVPGAVLRWDGPVTHVVVYTGDPGWVAVEPVTMANDGFGLAHRGHHGTGVHWLEPGAALSVSYRIDA